MKKRKMKKQRAEKQASELVVDVDEWYQMELELNEAERAFDNALNELEAAIKQLTKWTLEL